MLIVLDQVDLADATICGNKAAFLSELKRLGYLVPSSIVLPASVYDLFLHQNNLSAWLAERATESSAAAAARLIQIEREVGERFSRGHLPERVFRDIVAWSETIQMPVAVRSSATNEDRAGSSFAGMYSSALNVHSDTLPAAILQCFASLFSARASLYRRRSALAKPEVGRMAVLIQTMLAGDLAGVCFTRAPHRENLLLVECAPGVGSGIVGGTVAPSRFYVDRATIEIRDAKERHGVDRAMVLEIARMALAIERSLGRAQDIEYSVEAGEIYILQARPLSK